MTIEDYVLARQNLKYYLAVEKLLGSGHSILDVGPFGTDIVCRGRFTERWVVDIVPLNMPSNVHVVTSDYLKWTAPFVFDTVLCLQVLEHLSKPEEFAQKLFSDGKRVIISVPYKWPKGKCKHHVQDPVDEHKLKKWTKRDPVHKHVIKENCGTRRLIAVFEGRKA